MSEDLAVLLDRLEDRLRRGELGRPETDRARQAALPLDLRPAPADPTPEPSRWRALPGGGDA